MNKPLMDHLIADHERVRKLLARIRNDNGESCFETFRTLKAFVMANSKAEEFALYGLFEDPKDDASRVGLQHFTFEGYEEHDLIDFLMKEMGQADEITPQWKAQLKVLSEMLEHHFREEEDKFLPQALEVLSQEELAALAEAYVIERDQIFSKKTGVRPTPTPAVTLASSMRQ